MVRKFMLKKHLLTLRKYVGQSLVNLTNSKCWRNSQFTLHLCFTQFFPIFSFDPKTKDFLSLRAFQRECWVIEVLKKYRYNLHVRLGISNQMQVKQIDWNCHLSVSQFNRWKKCTKHFARRNKIYSEFLKTTSTLFILNPFVHNASFLYTLKTSEKLTVFWCFHEVEKGCIMNEWVHILFSNAPFWFPLKTSENFDKLQEKSLFMLSFATFFW